MMQKNIYLYKTRHKPNKQEKNQNFESRSDTVNINKLLNRVKINEEKNIKKKITFVILSILFIGFLFFLIF